MEIKTESLPALRMRVDLKSVFLFGMCLVYMIQTVLNIPWINMVLAVLAVGVFVFSLPTAKPFPRLFGLLMFSTAIILHLYKGDSMEMAVSGLVANTSLLSLMILVPLISIPLKLDGYLQSIHGYLQKWTVDARKMFASISLFLFSLGPVLNLGSIRVLHQMIEDLRLPPAVVAKSNVVGFSTVILWSPYFASVALVLSYLNVPIGHYVPLGLTMAVLQLVIGNLMFSFWWCKQKGRLGENFELPIAHTTGHDRDHLNIKRLFVFLVLLMGVIFLLESLSSWPMMFVVCLVAILYPLLWTTAKRAWQKVIDPLKEYQQQTVQVLNNEIVLFISAGMFGKALTGTSLADGIKLFLQNVATTSFVLFILIVMAIIVFFSFIGIHQIVVVTALVTQMEPSVIGTNPEVLALLIMVSWAAASILSPINPVNLLVSGFVRRSTMTVGLKWNGMYALVLLVVGGLFVYVLH